MNDCGECATFSLSAFYNFEQELSRALIFICCFAINSLYHHWSLNQVSVALEKGLQRGQHQRLRIRRALIQGDCSDDREL
jgi:hypothetical protein